MLATVGTGPGRRVGHFSRASIRPRGSGAVTSCGPASVGAALGRRPLDLAHTCVHLAAPRRSGRSVQSHDRAHATVPDRIGPVQSLDRVCLAAACCADAPDMLHLGG